ncbi:MAG: RimK/LysX family protein [Verrucomicrobiota bacterium]
MTENNSHPETKARVGWREWITFPEWSINAVKAKVDTGARTSAIHCATYEQIEGPDGDNWVQFEVEPDQRSTRRIVCQAPIIAQRSVRDSGGHEELRFFVLAKGVLGEHQWEFELSLTQRPNMKFRMLLGRTALEDRFLVDPAKSYVAGKSFDN